MQIQCGVLEMPVSQQQMKELEKRFTRGMPAPVTSFRIAGVPHKPKRKCLRAPAARAQSYSHPGWSKVRKIAFCFTFCFLVAENGRKWQGFDDVCDTRGLLKLLTINGLHGIAGIWGRATLRTRLLAVSVCQGMLSEGNPKP